MKCNSNRATETTIRKEQTKKILKQMLVSIRRSEGFGKDRLTRVLYEWVQLATEIHADKDEMFIVDEIIKEVMGDDVIKGIGETEMHINNLL